MNYYNEYDPKAAAWLRELIRQRLIPDGVVDARSIVDVQPADLTDYVQCHFFAGIGGWSYALQLAGWSPHEPVWTGSCPCQPFSSAGAQLGFADPRHLWPHFHRLITQCQPPTIFGEQVASKLGREWLAGVRTDLEGLGYAVGAGDLCAAGVGAPHIRQRLYWVAHSGRERLDGQHSLLRQETDRWVGEIKISETPRGSGIGILAHAQGGGQRINGGASGSMRHPDHTEKERLGFERVSVESEQEAIGPDTANPWSESDLIGCADGRARRVESGTFPLAHGVPARVGRLRGYGNTIVPQVAAQFIRASEESRVRLDLI